MKMVFAVFVLQAFSFEGRFNDRHKMQIHVCNINLAILGLECAQDCMVYQQSWHTCTVFEPAQLPQKTICPSVAFAKGQIGNSRGQSIIYYNINTVSVLSNKLSFCCPRKNKKLKKYKSR